MPDPGPDLQAAVERVEKLRAALKDPLYRHLPRGTSPRHYDDFARDLTLILSALRRISPSPASPENGSTQMIAAAPRAPAGAGEAVTHEAACAYADTSADPLAAMLRDADERLRAGDHLGVAVSLQGARLAQAYRALSAPVQGDGLKMLVGQDWLSRRTAADPDLDCETGGGDA